MLKDFIHSPHHIRHENEDLFETVPTIPIMGTRNLFPRSSEEVPGASMRMTHILWKQLSLPSIRSCMHWLQASDVSQSRRLHDKPIIAPFLIKFKISRDGFILRNKRCQIATIMTNCSIYGATNSVRHSDILSLADTNENMYNLHLLSQEVDKEMFVLRVFGIVDPVTADLVQVWGSSIEDTASVEKSLGQRGPLSDSKWLYSRHNASIHKDQRLTMHVPICIDAKFCSSQWNRLMQQYIQPECKKQGLDPYLLAFFGDNDFMPNHPRCSDYQSLNSKMKTESKQHGNVIGDWCRGETVWNFGLGPLHLDLRIFGHTLKWLMVSIIRYHQSLASTNNPPRGATVYAADRLHEHFKNCCCMKYSFVPNKITTLTVHECMFSHRWFLL